MKIFTRVILTLSGVLLCIGAVCVLAAGAMGITWNGFRQMVNEGKFSFDASDLNIDITDTGVDINFGEQIDISVGDGVQIDSTGNIIELNSFYENLSLEFGSGTLEIVYAAIPNVVIEKHSLSDFEVYDEDNTLCIKANTNIIGVVNNNASLKITLPLHMFFNTADIEIGASTATIDDLKAGDVSIEVGAGEATINQMTANKLSISVGAGEATLSNLGVTELDAEVGIGELNAIMKGDSSNYSYDVECGIGSVSIGENSYDGLGASQTVTPTGATCHMDVECGIGEVDIDFEN